MNTVRILTEKEYKRWMGLILNPERDALVPTIIFSNVIVTYIMRKEESQEIEDAINACFKKYPKELMEEVISNLKLATWKKGEETLQYTGKQSVLLYTWLMELVGFVPC